VGINSAIGAESSGTIIPSKEELALVRLVRLVVVGVLSGVDMVGMDEWKGGLLSIVGQNYRCLYSREGKDLRSVGRRCQ
jgi:hypothetical protein